MTDEAAKFEALRDSQKGRTPNMINVRVYRPMDQAVREFIETDMAQRRGFMYRMDVYVTAVRELLWKYGFFRPLSREEVTRI